MCAREWVPRSFLPETCASGYLSFLQCLSSKSSLHGDGHTPVDNFSAKELSLTISFCAQWKGRPRRPMALGKSSLVSSFAKTRICSSRQASRVLVTIWHADQLDSYG